MIYLMAINPLPLANILNGDKDIEMRLRPLKPGDEVHLYCTWRGGWFGRSGISENGGPFIWGKWFAACVDSRTLSGSKHNGRVVAKFTVGEVLPFVYFNIPKEEETMEMVDERTGESYTMEAPLTGEGIYITSGELKRTCLTYQAVCDYAKKRTVYGLTVTNLVIFDKPRELSEYRNEYGIPLTHAPQSYQRIYPEE